MWALYTVPSVAKYPHSPPPPPHHHPTPTPLPTLTNSTHTSVQHAWTHVCTFAHMQQGEWNAKWATWWKDTSTQTAFAYVGRGPFIQRDNVCVDFSLSAHFKHQKQQKEWGEEKKKKSDRHAITATDMFRLIQALRSYLFYNFLFSNHARALVWPAAYLTKTYLSG